MNELGLYVLTKINDKNNVQKGKFQKNKLRLILEIKKNKKIKTHAIKEYSPWTNHDIGCLWEGKEEKKLDWGRK